MSETEDFDAEDFDTEFDLAFKDCHDKNTSLICNNDDVKYKLDSATVAQLSTPPENPTLKQSHLTCCPREVLLRVLGFLSADDLSAVACSCVHLSEVAKEDVLWRRLFCARWGKPSGAPTKNEVWKLKYLDADSEEYRDTVSNVPQELRGIFGDMQKAKRQACLGRAFVDDTAELPRCQIQQQLTIWRQQRGFGDSSSSQRPDLTKANLKFHRIGPDIFVCEHTGWEHHCDHTCLEGYIDSESGLITCPVSGRVSETLSYAEEICMQHGSNVDAYAVDSELNSFSAARAFTEGYYAAADGKEMRLRYGIHLR